MAFLLGIDFSKYITGDEKTGVTITDQEELNEIREAVKEVETGKAKLIPLSEFIHELQEQQKRVS